METLLAFLKKIAVQALKKAVSKIRKETKRFLNDIKNAFKKIIAGEKPTLSKKTKRNILKAVLLPVCTLLLLFMVILLPVIVIGGSVLIVFAVMLSVVQTAFADSSAFDAVVNQYWAKYNSGYGTATQIREASEEDRLLFLLDHDDFWTDISPYLVYDQESMRYIIEQSEKLNSDFTPVETIRSEVTVYKGTEKLTPRTGEKFYSLNTPIYVQVGNNTCEWQILYGILAGTTKGKNNHISEEAVTEIVNGLTPDVEPENLFEYREPVSISTVKKGTYEEEKALALTSDIVQGSSTMEPDDRLTVTVKGVSYQKSQLTYSRLCPVVSGYDKLTLWSGTLIKNASGRYDYACDDAVILSVLEEHNMHLNTDRAIKCVVRVSDGYAKARKLSEVISDGTVNVDTDYGSLTDIVGDRELLEMILQALRVTAGDSGGGGDPGEYEDHGEYVVFEPLGENRPSVVWWTQLQYTDKLYGISPISSNGCGPSSLAIVYSSLTGDIRDPAQMAEWCYKNGYAYTAGGQTVGTASIFSQGAIDLGLTVDYYGTGPDAFLEAVPYLEQGDLIVCNVGCYARGNSIFSGQGHFLVVRGYENGEIILADPGKRTAEQNTKRYPLSDMLQILDRRAVGNTGRVWAIGYKK